MGGSSYSDYARSSRLYADKSAGKSSFYHTAAVDSGAVAASVHDLLDPKKLNKVGKNIRESFDSPEHPNSLPIVVAFDVTGSMREVPKLFIEKLGALMGLLVKKDYVRDPHIAFLAIGDATCDNAPLQVGQFESGNEMDMALSHVYLEGGGGGHVTESYELAMYYLARHTELDSLSKRGKKGFCFLMGDEIPYKLVDKGQVKTYIGDTIQANIPTEDILNELREKFEVFWILPGGTSNYNSTSVTEPLKKMFGQNLLKIENPADICELIASTIALAEGYELNDIKDGLKDVGADKDSVARATKALTKYSAKSVSRKSKVSGSLVPAGARDVERL